MQQAKLNFVQQIALMAIMAAVYTVLTWLIQPIAYGLFQFRISDMLLPFPFIFGWPMAIALFIGGALANWLSFFGPIDIIFGSLLNLLAGLLVSNRKTCPHWFLAWLYPTLTIGLGIPAMMAVFFFQPFYLWVITVMTSTAIICAIGVGVMQAITRALPQYFKAD
ncbi:MAG: QueT transporter family protein [Candidatus Hodarchaeota archaeon]